KDSSADPAIGIITLPNNPIVGQSVTYGYTRSSSLIADDILSHTWYVYYDDGTKSPAILTGTTPTLTISNMPDNLTGIELFLAINPNACYTTASNGVIIINNLDITPLPVE